jgi:hypothetical protein
LQPDPIYREREWDQAVKFRARLGPSVHILQFVWRVVTQKFAALSRRTTLSFILGTLALRRQSEGSCENDLCRELIKGTDMSSADAVKR